MPKLLVTPRSGDYIAQLEGTSIWEVGQTATQAMGEFLRSRHAEIGLELEVRYEPRPDNASMLELSRRERGLVRQEDSSPVSEPECVLSAREAAALLEALGDRAEALAAPLGSSVEKLRAVLARDVVNT